MNTRTIITLAALTVALPVVGLYAAEGKADQKERQPTVTVQGEVLDMVCFLDHGAKGAKHKDCAVMCVKGGAPVGLLAADGKVYLALEDHNTPAPYQALRGMAAEQVIVKGTVVDRGGVRGIIVKSAEKAKA